MNISFSEPDRQNSGKACVLGDTTRILKDLVSQVESLRKENITLKNESHYVRSFEQGNSTHKLTFD
jgi:hypothetical protein